MNVLATKISLQPKQVPRNRNYVSGNFCDSWKQKVSQNFIRVQGKFN